MEVQDFAQERGCTVQDHHGVLTVVGPASGHDGYEVVGQVVLFAIDLAVEEGTVQSFDDIEEPTFEVLPPVAEMAFQPPPPPGQPPIGVQEEALPPQEEALPPRKRLCPPRRRLCPASRRPQSFARS